MTTTYLNHIHPARMARMVPLAGRTSLLGSGCLRRRFLGRSRHLYEWIRWTKKAWRQGDGGLEEKTGGEDVRVTVEVGVKRGLE